MLPRTRRILSILAAATLATSLSLTAHAQYKVGDDGRLLDANQRLGSGGYNDGPITEPGLMLGNNIVTGNVTGGKQFRGYVPYTDPNVFRGISSTRSMDQFIANSGGVPAYGSNLSIPGTVRPFYGGNVMNPQAAGLVPHGVTGTYTIKPPDNSNGVPQFDSRIQPIRIDSAITLPSGDMIIPGPVDPMSNQRTYYTASPLMGVRAWKPGDIADQDFLQKFSALRSEGALDRLHIDNRSLEEMQDELHGDIGEKPVISNQNMARPVPPPIDAPGSVLLRNKPLTDQVATGLINNQLGSPITGFERRTTLVPPSEQSSQYAELQKRLNSYYSDLIKGNESSFPDAAKQLKQAAGQETRIPGEITQPNPTTPGDVTIPAAPGAATPDYNTIGREILGGTGPLNVSASPDRLKITSLASGVRAKGLSRLIIEGETLMKQGKYDSALTRFEAAQAVAPNNFMITLGRGNAALGAGYFKKAETLLRTALQRDPVLLMAQFDLKNMIGQDRLVVVVRDLKNAANKQADDAGLAMLLAYIAYNTGNPEQAGLYLDLAEQRSSGQDNFYRVLRQYWKVPSNLHADYAPFELSELMKQIEDANVARIQLKDNMLLGEFKKPTTAPGKTRPQTSFRSPLPTGAESGPLLKWIREHAGDAKVDLGNTPAGK